MPMCDRDEVDLCQWPRESFHWTTTLLLYMPIPH